MTCIAVSSRQPDVWVQGWRGELLLAAADQYVHTNARRGWGHPPLPCTQVPNPCSDDRKRNIKKMNLYEDHRTVSRPLLVWPKTVKRNPRQSAAEVEAINFAFWIVLSTWPTVVVNWLLSRFFVWNVVAHVIELPLGVATAWSLASWRHGCWVPTPVTYKWNRRGRIPRESNSKTWFSTRNSGQYPTMARIRGMTKRVNF